ncbi:DNA-directed RNA polymerases I, II, and III subunit RPABC5 [Enteropsectra breve]|nr:DNA-directed RNA polymerases I, II, and III subunit RPABC5 [Enteropsectra breve]
MIIPVRCFTCNKEISSHYETYLDKTRENIHPRDALNAIGFKRMCCRRMFLGHVDIADQLMNFEGHESAMM